ncbi:hypothetical protein ACF3M1_09410 [Luteimonas sp. WGS1318]|uniref:hypothetical protein n=1 Tax=Luteimonas sp. WGS1318 TaxID=3366815 RepID=UPI00372D109A
MSGTKKPTASGGGTRHLFAGARTASERASSLTSERIADDVAAFCGSGGSIEKLGTTRTLTRLDEHPAPVPAPAGPGRGGR